MEQDDTSENKQKSKIHWAAGRLGIARWEEELAKIEQGLRRGAESRKGASETLSNWLDSIRLLPESERVFLAQLDPPIREEVLQLSERIIDAIFQCADEHGLKLTAEDDRRKSSQRKPGPRNR